MSAVSSHLRLGAGGTKGGITTRKADAAPCYAVI